MVRPTLRDFWHLPHLKPAHRVLFLTPFVLFGLLLVISAPTLPFGSSRNDPYSLGSPKSLWPSISRPVVVRDAAVKGCLKKEDQVLLPRVKGCILLLARNQDLDKLVTSIISFEKMFNNDFNYPYVFLSETPFDANFIPTIRKHINPLTKTETGLITHAQGWGPPSWMSQDDIDAALKQQDKNGVQYGGMLSYHNMCRFYSGPFAMHPILAKYDFYWRLEPSVDFFCKLTYDPFRFMVENNKVYGWNIAVIERVETIPTLFSTLQTYRSSLIQSGTISSDNTQYWRMFEADGVGNHGWGESGIGEKPGEWGYNLCHFWTNFEIGDLRFFRSDKYQNLFKHLDSTGKFYFERWGDAPIRSLALAMFTTLNQTHHFDDISYIHDSWMHCPETEQTGVGCDCHCPTDKHRIGGDGWYSCLPRWNEINTLSNIQ